MSDDPGWDAEMVLTQVGRDQRYANSLLWVDHPHNRGCILPPKDHRDELAGDARDSLVLVAIWLTVALWVATATIAAIMAHL